MLASGEQIPEQVWIRFTANEIAEIEERFTGVSARMPSEELARQIGTCWGTTADDVVWTSLPLFHYNALVTAVLGLGKDAILYGPDMLGRLLDTFVAAQLRAELAASSNDPRLYHLREEQGRREVDLLIETASGQLIGIEVKAARDGMTVEL